MRARNLLSITAIVVAAAASVATSEGDRPRPDTGFRDSGWWWDGDGDGWFAQDDCDDNNFAVNPAAFEVCDEIDNNCDGNADEGLTVQAWLDEDGDGWGTTLETLQSCTGAEGYTDQSGDCDDTRGEVFPGAGEACNGYDDDCDGLVDVVFAGDLDAGLPVGVTAHGGAGWTEYGGGGHLRLADASTGLPGTAVSTGTVGGDFVATFRFSLGGEAPEGVLFTALYSNDGYLDGARYGVFGLAGWAVAFDAKGEVALYALSEGLKVEGAPVELALDTEHTAAIDYAAGVVTVTVDGATALTRDIGPLLQPAHLGFAGSATGAYSRVWVDDPSLGCGD